MHRFRSIVHAIPHHRRLIHNNSTRFNENKFALRLPGQAYVGIIGKTTLRLTSISEQIEVVQMNGSHFILHTSQERVSYSFNRIQHFSYSNTSQAPSHITCAARFHQRNCKQLNNATTCSPVDGSVAGMVRASSSSHFSRKDENRGCGYRTLSSSGALLSSTGLFQSLPSSTGVVSAAGCRSRSDEANRRRGPGDAG